MFLPFDNGRYSKFFFKIAFLNCELHDELYVFPPLSIAHRPTEVYWLQKGLYGLKQASCAWFVKLSTKITSLGFNYNNHDLKLFLRCTSADRILLFWYIYHMIISSDDDDGI